MGGEDKDFLVKILIHKGNFNFAYVYPFWNSGGRYFILVAV